MLSKNVGFGGLNFNQKKYANQEIFVICAMKTRSFSQNPLRKKKTPEKGNIVEFYREF